MNTLQTEKEITTTALATEAVEMIDCGRVSERTQGFPFLLLWEPVNPPFNTLIL
jgi:hypothetical protein